MEVTASVVASSGEAGNIDLAAAVVELTEEAPVGEARFAFTAPTTACVAEVTFEATVTSGAGTGDAVTVTIETIGVQDAITRGGTLRVAAGETVTQALELPDAAPGTGTVAVAASVGDLASVQLLAQRLLDSVPPRGFSGPWVVASIGVHAALLQFGDAAFSTTFSLSPRAASQLGVNATTNGTLPGCEALAALLEYTVDAVAALTDGNLIGLTVDSEDSYMGRVPPRRADAFLNLAVRLQLLACVVPLTTTGCDQRSFLWGRHTAQQP